MVQERIFKRTRLAPTPSGYLHIGNIAAFVLTAGLARRYGAEILLRIDDLDRQRVRRAYVEDIFESLSFLGIPWDLGPRDVQSFEKDFTQQNRVYLYQEVLQYLADQKAVFACACSRTQLERTGASGCYPGTCLSKAYALEDPGKSWRLLTETPNRIQVRTLNGQPLIAELPESMQYLQVRKKDGQASYQLGSLVDDLYFNIDMIVRGVDLFDSTLGQLYLSEQLPENHFRQVTFVHHPLLMEDALHKLSKSAGSTSVQYLRRQGMDRAGVFGTIARHAGLTDRPGTWEELFELLVDAWEI